MHAPAMILGGHEAQYKGKGSKKKALYNIQAPRSHRFSNHFGVIRPDSRAGEIARKPGRNGLKTAILIACAEMVKTGGVGDSIADLPAAGAAPEWYSEKAIAIGRYFVASGVHTVFGVTFPIIEETKCHRLLFDKMRQQGLGRWGFTADPQEMARLMIQHIDERRRVLGIDKVRERTLVDMADRRQLESA